MRLNMAHLYARVAKRPILNMDTETGEYNYGMVYLDTVRSLRHVDDGIVFLKHEHPIVISREPAIVNNIKDLEENDIVLIKGVVTSKSMNKISYCPECTDEDEKPTKNTTRGNLVYVTPIFVKKVTSYTDKKLAVEDLIENREISNQIYVAGTLIRNPKAFSTKKGLKITQFPIAINRKFTIRSDDPVIRTDWPVVKSYGEQALEDAIRLELGSEIIVDGFMQARTVERKVKCKCCGKIYPYKDHSMEIVPYTTEYTGRYKSDDQIEAEFQKKVNDIKQSLFDSLTNDYSDEDMNSTDVTE